MYWTIFVEWLVKILYFTNYRELVPKTRVRPGARDENCFWFRSCAVKTKRGVLERTLKFNRIRLPEIDENKIHPFSQKYSS